MPKSDVSTSVKIKTIIKDYPNELILGRKLLYGVVCVTVMFNLEKRHYVESHRNSSKTSKTA